MSKRATLWLSATLAAMSAQCIFPPWVMVTFVTHENDYSQNAYRPAKIPLKHPYQRQHNRYYGFVWAQYRANYDTKVVNNSVDWKRLTLQLLATFFFGAAGVVASLHSTGRKQKAVERLPLPNELTTGSNGN